MRHLEKGVMKFNLKGGSELRLLPEELVRYNEGFTQFVFEIGA